MEVGDMKLNRRKHLVRYLIVFGVMAAMSPGLVVAEEPQEVFDSIFKNKLAEAARTSTKDDDRALAQEMLALVKDAQNSPRLVELLCEGAYGLTSKYAAGYGIASRAMDQLLTSGLGKRKTVITRLLDMLKKTYITAPRKLKTATGKLYIQRLQAEAVTATDLGNAVSYLQEALRVAKVVQPTIVRSLNNTLIETKNKRASENNIRFLLAKLKAGDKKAAIELVRAYIIELDRPTEALKYGFLLTDPEWKANVSLAAKGGAITAADGVTLGDWYRGLAHKNKYYEGSLLKRAYQYYQHYLLNTPGDSLTKTKVTLTVKTLQRDLVRLKINVTETKLLPTPAIMAGQFKHKALFKDAALTAKHWEFKSGVTPPGDPSKDLGHPRKINTSPHGFREGERGNYSLRSRFKFQGDFQMSVHASFGRAKFSNTGGAYLSVHGHRFTISKGPGAFMLNGVIRKTGNRLVFTNGGQITTVTLLPHRANEPTDIYIFWRSRTSFFTLIWIFAERSGDAPVPPTSAHPPTAAASSIPRTRDELVQYLKGSVWQGPGKATLTLSADGTIKAVWYDGEPWAVSEDKRLLFSIHVYSFSADFKTITGYALGSGKKAPRRFTLIKARTQDE